MRPVTDLQRKVAPFEVVTEMVPAGDQPAAIAQITARVASLTPREREVLNLLVGGSPNKTIAYDLGTSPRTIEVHRARVMEKMGARSLAELVRMMIAAPLGGISSGTPDASPSLDGDAPPGAGARRPPGG